MLKNKEQTSVETQGELFQKEFKNRCERILDESEGAKLTFILCLHRAISDIFDHKIAIDAKGNHNATYGYKRLSGVYVGKKYTEDAYLKFITEKIRKPPSSGEDISLLQFLFRKEGADKVRAILQISKIDIESFFTTVAGMMKRHMFSDNDAYQAIETNWVFNPDEPLPKKLITLTRYETISGEEDRSKGFRKYLSKSRIPYKTVIDNYSTSTLAEIIRSKEYAGLIIKGKGGIGKTRLTVELANTFQEAPDSDWLVLEVIKNFKSETIEILLQELEEKGFKGNVLLVLDYIETQKHFIEIIEAIESYNQYGASLFYIANCRTTYFSTLPSDWDNYYLVDLDQAMDISEESIVRHILAQYYEEKDIVDILKICKNLPIIAVFMCYLKHENKSKDLIEIRETSEFSEWIKNRFDGLVNKEYEFNNIKKIQWKEILSRLLCQYPVTISTLDDLIQKNEDMHFYQNQLEDFGLVYENDEREYQLVHDVFADDLIRECCSRLSEKNKRRFVQATLKFSADIKNIPSTMLALQRVVNYFEISWLDVFKETFKNEELPSWCGNGHFICSFPKITLEEFRQITVLAPEYWRKEAGFSEYRKALAAKLYKRVEFGRIEDIEVVPEEKKKTVGWIKEIIKEHGLLTNYYLISKALQFDVAEFEPLVKTYLFKHFNHRGALELLNQYVMFEYKKRSHENVIEDELFKIVQRVFSKKSKHYFSDCFFYSNWLRYIGKTGFIDEQLKSWLDLYSKHDDVRLVHDGILKSYESDVFDTYVLGWLDNRESTKEATSFYINWAKTNRPFEVIWPKLKIWLDVNLKSVFDEASRLWILKHGLPLFEALIVNGQLSKDIVNYLCLWLESIRGGKGEERTFENIFIKCIEAYKKQMRDAGVQDVDNRGNVHIPLQLREYYIRWLIKKPFDKNTYGESLHRKVLQNVSIGDDLVSVFKFYLDDLDNVSVQFFQDIIYLGYFELYFSNHFYKWLNLDCRMSDNRVQFVLRNFINNRFEESIIKSFITQWLSNSKIDQESKIDLVVNWLRFGYSEGTVEGFVKALKGEYVVDFYERWFDSYIESPSKNSDLITDKLSSEIEEKRILSEVCMSSFVKLVIYAEKLGVRDLDHEELCLKLNQNPDEVIDEFKPLIRAIRLLVDGKAVLVTLVNLYRREKVAKLKNEVLSYGTKIVPEGRVYEIIFELNQVFYIKRNNSLSDSLEDKLGLYELFKILLKKQIFTLPSIEWHREALKKIKSGPKWKEIQSPWASHTLEESLEVSLISVRDNSADIDKFIQWLALFDHSRKINLQDDLVRITENYQIEFPGVVGVI